MKHLKRFLIGFLIVLIPIILGKLLGGFQTARTAVLYTLAIIISLGFIYAIGLMVEFMSDSED